MASVHIYTTGGDLIAGPGSTRVETLIDSLGVVPPWQACFCDPAAGLLIHIVTATRREAGSAARRANNYYFAIQDTSTEPAALWTTLQEALTNRLADPDSPWQEVPTEDDLKSPLSAPAHIEAIATSSSTPQTLPQEAIAVALESDGATLRFGFDSAASLQRAVALCMKPPAILSYGTTITAEAPPNVSVQFELGADRPFEPVDSATTTRLSDAVEIVAERHRETSVDSVAEALSAIELGVESGAIDPQTAISVLTQGLDILGEPLNSEATDQLRMYQQTLSTTHEAVRQEAAVEDWRHIDGVHSRLQTYTEGFETAIEELLTTTIADIRQAVIADSVKSFVDYVDRQIAGAVDTESVEPPTVEQAIAEVLLEETPSQGVGQSLREMFSLGTARVDAPAELQTVLRECRVRADTTVIPKLVTKTGLDESTVRSRFYEGLSSSALVESGPSNE